MSRLPDPTVMFADQPEDILVTMAVFGEALNCTEEARRGMLNAARNRLIHWRPEYGIRTWHGILLRAWQFDCFRSLRDKLLNPLKYESQEAWDGCYELAKDCLNGLIKDNVERSTFYYDSSMDHNPPSWTKTQLLEHVIDIDALRFWRYDNE